MIKHAELSPDRKYRFALWRIWDESKPYVMFIGLNPSTADETEDDPTIRRCISFAKSWGFGGVAMVNVYAWRDVSPRSLLFQYFPEGNDNDQHIRATADRCALHIAAWGNGSLIREMTPDRIDEIRRYLPDLYYLQLNTDGTPGHPLYLKGDLLPKLWNRDK